MAVLFSEPPPINILISPPPPVNYYQPLDKPVRCSATGDKKSRVTVATHPSASDRIYVSSQEIQSHRSLASLGCSGVHLKPRPSTSNRHLFIFILQLSKSCLPSKFV